MVVSTDLDEDGDSTVERKISDTTVLDTDGSTSRTVAVLAADGITLIGKTLTTKLASGMLTSVRSDFDGNGTFDQTVVDGIFLAYDGSRTDTTTIQDSAQHTITLVQTITRADKRNIVVTADLDGDGLNDEKRTTIFNDNGTTSETSETYDSVGLLASKAIRTLSTNGLSETLTVDSNGDGSTDRSSTDTTLLAGDGTRVRTVANLRGAEADKTTVTTSSNGLTRTIDWIAAGTVVSRNMTDVTVLDASGGTERTVTFSKAGIRESQTKTTFNNVTHTTTTVQDINGDQVADITTVLAQLTDGRIQTTQSGTQVNGTTGQKIVTTSANGLSSSTQHISKQGSSYPTDLNYTITTSTTLFDTSRQVLTTKSTTDLVEQSRVRIDDDGFYSKSEWDVDGDGTFESSYEDSTVLAPSGARTRTEKDLDGTVVARQRTTATSANGLSITTTQAIFGTDSFTQSSTDVTAINTDGSRTRTVNYRRSDNTLLSAAVIKTDADGRTITIDENLDGLSSNDRQRIFTAVDLADGTTVETWKTLSPTGALLDVETTTSEPDNKRVIVIRDADGDGTTDQTETTANFVDGSSKTVITDIGPVGDKSSQVMIFTSADGRKITSEWDFDGNDIVDQRRVTDKTEYSDNSWLIVSSDTSVATNALMSRVTTTISADGATQTIKTDVDGDGDTDKKEDVTRHIDGSITRVIDGELSGGIKGPLIAGQVYFRRDTAASATVHTTADGLTTTVDAIYGPEGSRIRQNAVSQTFIDGSVVTNIEEKQSGSTIAKGVVTVSADGLTTTLLKDGNNNTTYEHTETATTRIDGSIRLETWDKITSEAPETKSVTVVSADGKSTSVILMVASAGTGTSTGVGVEFLASDSTNDTITGSSGDDSIKGGDGIDSINGGSGDDVIDGGLDADIMRGGSGNDVFYVDNVSDQVIESSNEGTDTVCSAVTYTLADPDVENLTLIGSNVVDATGNSLDNAIVGNVAINSIDGSGGNDTLDGAGGNDVLSGGSGNDTFTGGTDNDSLKGGLGDDRYIFGRGDGGDTLSDYSFVETTDEADIEAARAIGLSPRGLTDTWKDGYLLRSSGELLKITTAGTETVVMGNGISASDLSFAWSGAGSDDLTITIAGGAAGDKMRLLNQDTAARFEKIQFDGQTAINFTVAQLGGTIAGTSNADLIFGLSGDETLNDGLGDDTLYGGAGDDALASGAGNDTLIGGTGADYIRGGSNDDRYLFGRGDGSDTYSDYSFVVTEDAGDLGAASAIGVSATGLVNTWKDGYMWQTSSGNLIKILATGTDTLVLEDGIKAEDLSFSWSGPGSDDLTITISGGPAGDKIKLYNQTTDARIEKIQFDGQVAVSFQVAQTGGTVTGTSDNDFVFGLSGGELLYGGGGDDIIFGGLGTDVLKGQGGDDSYRFNAGDGADTIVESGLYGDSDQLVFGSEIDWDELWFAQQSNDLVISVLGTTDKVTVQNWFLNAGNIVETIRSGDGGTLSHYDVSSLIAAMSSFSPSTSPTGPGIVPDDSRLGSPTQIGTIASAMNSAWQHA